MSVVVYAPRILGIDYRPAHGRALHAEGLGACTVILAANAAGKSVLARQLAGGPGGDDELRLQVSGAWTAAPALLAFEELLGGRLDPDAVSAAAAGGPNGGAWVGELARTDQRLAAFAEAGDLRPGASQTGGSEAGGSSADHGADLGRSTSQVEDAEGERAAALVAVERQIDELRAALRDDADVPEAATLQRSLSLLRGLANWPSTAAAPAALAPTAPAGPLAPLPAIAAPQPVVAPRPNAGRRPPDPETDRWEPAVAPFGGVLGWACRVHPALLATMGVLVVASVALMIGGRSVWAVPVSLVAVCAALLALLAPPADRGAPVPFGLGSLTRLLVSDVELDVATPAGRGTWNGTADAAQLPAAPRPVVDAHPHRLTDDRPTAGRPERAQPVAPPGGAPSLPNPRSVSLALLALPTDAGPAEIERCRVGLEAQLDERRRLDQLRLELGQRLEQRRALLRVAEPQPRPPTAAARWQELLEARRRVVLEAVERRRRERHEAERERRATTVAELTRLRRELLARPDDRAGSPVDACLARLTAGRWVHLRTEPAGPAGATGAAEAVTVAVAADGSVRPVSQLARTERQLAALAVGLAAGERERPGLPLVLDDVLLGLDGAHLEAAAAYVAHLADARQVVVFTSSPGTAAALGRARPGAHVVEWS